MNIFGLRESLRRQLWLVIAVVLAVFLGSSVFTLHALSLRKHDYLILNLTGQLRVNQRHMLDQATRYLQNAADDYKKYDRDLATYWRDLQGQIELSERIVDSLRSRRIDPRFVGRDEAIQCTWDNRSRSQMERSAVDWGNFRSGLEIKLGPDSNAPRLEWAAEYVVLHGEEMAQSAERLARAFQTMMEGKLNEIRLFQIIAAATGLGLLLLIATAADVRVLRPLNRTVAGFGRVAQGEFGHQLPVAGNDEIGRMTQSFNALSSRLDAVFRLTDSINRGTHLDEMLELSLAEFRRFVHVDWLGVFFVDAGGETLRFDRARGALLDALSSGEAFATDDALFEQSVAQGRTLAIGDLHLVGAAGDKDDLTRRLIAAGYESALILPVLGERGALGVLVCASKVPAAYRPEDAEFFGNLAGQIGHILEKTVVTEGLVVAAVEGLAKLAESRDPETGDHLVRMSRYSAVVTEELGRDEAWRSRIDASYVRDILRFAPMHDIGKVGIADSILLKPGRLDEAERREMERHPAIGALALRRCEAQMNALGRSIFAIGIEIAECHHEKFDGSGYPMGLAGDAIPLSARIVAVADVFDALTSKRPYKEAWSVDKALAMLNEAAGRHFDPAVVAAFHRALPKIMEIYDRHKHV